MYFSFFLFLVDKQNDTVDGIDAKNGNSINVFGLPHNVLVLKQVFSIEEQIGLIELSHSFEPATHLVARKHPQHTPWIYYNWPDRFNVIEQKQNNYHKDNPNNDRNIGKKVNNLKMESLMHLGSVLGKLIVKIVDIAQKNDQDDTENDKEINDPDDNLPHNDEIERKVENSVAIPTDNMNETDERRDGVAKDKNANMKLHRPEAIYGILYPRHGVLGSHKDAHMGWIIAISIGATAKFWYSNGNPNENDNDNNNDNDKQDDGKEKEKHKDKDNINVKKDEKIEINVESGDIMVFPGYKLLHAVDDVDPNTTPRFWKILQARQIIPVVFARYCLQFRHPLVV